MGCGSSTSVGTFGSRVERDPEDFHLDEIKLARVKVPEFDEWMDKFEDPVNSVIQMNNTINDIITDIKDACATLMGAYKVKVHLEGVKSSDLVVLELVRSDGKPVSGSTLEELQKRPEITKADNELSVALGTMHKALRNHTRYACLSTCDTGLCGEGCPEEVTKFNLALESFRKAVGGDYKVNMIIRHTNAFGAPTFDVALEKPVFENPDADAPVLKPVTLLDIAKTRKARSIVNALATVYEQTAATAAASKALEDVKFTLKKKKVVGTCNSKCADDSKKDEYRVKILAFKRAINTANTAMFKLIKASAHINGDINLAVALIEVVKSLKAKIAKLGGDVNKITPKIKFAADEETGELKFDIKFDLGKPDWQFPSILPGPARAVYDCIMEIVKEVKELVPKFGDVKDQVSGLIDESREVFDNPKERFDAAGMDLIAAGKAMAAIAKNGVTIMGCAGTITTFFNTVRRVADELKKGADELSNITK